MAQTPQEKFSFILYQKGRVPKFFKIGRPLFKFYFYIVPVLVLALFLSCFLFIFYFKEIRLMVKRKEPAIIQELKQNKAELLILNQDLDSKVKDLEERLYGAGDKDKASHTILSRLSLFQSVPGQDNLVAKPLLSIDNISFEDRDQITRVRFTLMNITEEDSKLAGYIFIMLRTGDGLHIYPANAFKDGEMKLQVNQGEYFAIKRGRPVEADFPKFKTGPNTLLNVYIFSRTGDLLQHQTLSTDKGL